MNLKTSMNFSFRRLSSKIRSITEQYADGIAKHSAEASKKAIMDGLSPPLKESTINIRKFRSKGTGSKPLKYTGALYSSIKPVKGGWKMWSYGLNQHRGFTPKKIPYIRKVNDKDKLYFARNKKGIQVPARPFIVTSGATKPFNRFRRSIRKSLRLKAFR